MWGEGCVFMPPWASWSGFPLPDSEMTAWNVCCVGPGMGISGTRSSRSAHLTIHTVQRYPPSTSSSTLPGLWLSVAPISYLILWSQLSVVGEPGLFLWGRSTESRGAGRVAAG